MRADFRYYVLTPYTRILDHLGNTKEFIQVVSQGIVYIGMFSLL